VTAVITFVTPVFLSMWQLMVLHLTPLHIASVPQALWWAIQIGRRLLHAQPSAGALSHLGVGSSHVGWHRSAEAVVLRCHTNPGEQRVSGSAEAKMNPVRAATRKRAIARFVDDLEEITTASFL